jgi:hypothetical protein
MLAVLPARPAQHAVAHGRLLDGLAEFLHEQLPEEAT